MDYKHNKPILEKILGKESAYHNTYTAISFPPNGRKQKRSKPTPLTAEEDLKEIRYTGMMELEISTTSPLLTSESDPFDENENSKTGIKDVKYKSYRALTIGEDVIVPKSGVTGSLRNLLTILTGGVICNLDEDLILCQGRDLQMVLPCEENPKNLPVAVLAKIIYSGNQFRDGEIQLGETLPVNLEDLRSLMPSDPKEREDIENSFRDARGKIRVFFINNPQFPTLDSDRYSHSTPWQVRFSGQMGNKKTEAAFRSNGRHIPLPSQLWRDYAGRHRQSIRPELKNGDLVWLETRTPDGSIRGSHDVVSIQWARWGRKGQPLLQIIPNDLIPDTLKNDGFVGEITNLFGLVMPKGGKCPNFAARIRPDNLVFENTKKDLIKNVRLAPLAQPHLGCMAFYRNTDDPSQNAQSFGLRGYKVYRTTLEEGVWRFEVQGIFDKSGQLEEFEKCDLCKNVELLPAGMKGQLNISFRSLSNRELSLLLLACSVPWRLGGGKPFGLGSCSVKFLRIVDELGNKMELPLEWKKEVEDIKDRTAIWIASQTPVPKMRSPRAVETDQYGKIRGGHAWSKRHATPKKDDNQQASVLESRPLGNPLKEASGCDIMPGQPLPFFNPDDPLSDLLYGYDMIVTDSKTEQGQPTIINAIEPFDPKKHLTGKETSAGNHSQNRETRQQQRAARGELPSQNISTKTQPTQELIKSNSYEFEICPDPKGGDKLCAKHQSTGKIGNIINPAEVPDKLKKNGENIILKVWILNPAQKQLQLKWFPPKGEKQADKLK